MTTMQPLLLSMLSGFVAVGLFELSPRAKRPNPGGRRRPWPSLALGLLLAMLALGTAAQPGSAAAAGPSLALLALGALPLLLAAHVSDRRGPKSERHLAALAMGIAVALAAGVRVQFVGVPGNESVTYLGAASAVIVTALWIFLAVCIFELTSLLPLLPGIVALALGLAGATEGGSLRTFASVALGGIVAGAVLGRTAMSLLLHGGRPLEKAEVLTLGYATALVTVLSVIKGITFAGLIVPFGLFSIVVIVAILRVFDRDLLLRPSPRR